MKCLKCGEEWQEETVTVCPSCGAPLPSNAGEDIYARGVSAEREAKYKTASRFYAAAADLGVPCAAFAVCRTLEKSGERRENPDLYEFWLFTAARRDAIATLAYSEYLGRMGDTRGAFRYLRAAADMGHEAAIMRLGRYYLRHGNRPAARYFFKKAKGRLSARVYLFLLGKRKPTFEPEPPEMPDRSVESYTIGSYALTLGLPHIAYSYFEESAGAAYLPAMEKVADMCMRGNGCERNEEKVQSYLIALGEAGRTDAFILLGDYFTSGALGGTPNPFAAYEMYLRAARAKNPAGMLLVGDCLCDGTGTERNVEEGLGWYDRAAALGSEEAARRAARVRAEGVRLCEEAKAALAAGDDAHALLAYREAAGLGNIDAVCALGDMYLGGRGVKASPKAAAIRYARAAAQGDARAEYRLANLMLLNHGVRFDANTAKQLLEAALKQGYTPAADKLKEMKQREKKYLAQRLYAVSCAVYWRGDHTKSAALRAAAAQMGHPRAAFLLGCMYDCGDGVERDSARARALYDKALSLGFDGRGNGFMSKYLHRLPR